MRPKDLSFEKARKWYVRVVIVVCVIMLLVVFRADITRFWFESQLGDRCENEADFNIKNLHGQILVSWKADVNTNERIGIIDSYGLTYVADYYGNSGVVKVPEGKERKWECILRENPMIVGTQTFGKLVPWRET
jgi:hypothetical protein